MSEATGEEAVEVEQTPPASPSRPREPAKLIATLNARRVALESAFTEKEEELEEQRKELKVRAQRPQADSGPATTSTPSRLLQRC